MSDIYYSPEQHFDQLPLVYKQGWQAASNYKDVTTNPYNAATENYNHELWIVGFYAKHKTDEQRLKSMYSI